MEVRSGFSVLCLLAGTSVTEELLRVIVSSTSSTLPMLLSATVHLRAFLLCGDPGSVSLKLISSSSSLVTSPNDLAIDLSLNVSSIDLSTFSIILRFVALELIVLFALILDSLSSLMIFFRVVNANCQSETRRPLNQDRVQT